MESFKKLQLERDSNNQKIIDYVYSQRDLWKQMPWYCLQTNGIDGYNDYKSHCYYHKEYLIHSSISQGCYTIYVDCETGILCRSAGSPVEADDKFLGYVDLEELDAAAIIKDYQKDIRDSKKKPKRGDYVFPNKMKQSDRDKIAKECNIKPQ